MATIKVQILDSLVGNDPDGGESFQYGKGAIVDMPTARAKSLIMGGLAIEIREEKQTAQAPTVGSETHKK